MELRFMEKLKPVTRRTVTVCAVISLALFFCVGVSTLLFHDYSSLSLTRVWTPSSTNAASNSCHAPPLSLIPNRRKEQKKADPVKSLLEDLKERTLLAAGNFISLSLSAEEEAEWERTNPCRSRTELPALYALRKYAKPLPANLLWEEVFREYSAYHRVCMAAEGDSLARHFSNRTSTRGCQFVVADAGEWIGVGNKLQVIGNAILYGIITRRVILLPTSHLLTQHVCEPFPGSSWILDSASFPTPPESHRPDWALSTEVFDHIDDCLARDGGIPNPLPYAAGAGDTTNQKQPFQRFYCPTEQAFFSQITWIYLSGCIYTIPKIFAIPTFRPTLETLFPDKVVLTRLFRSMLLPADPVWSRVSRLFETYLQPSDRRVGIQMRYLLGAAQYEEMHELVNKRVVDCVLENGILPQVEKEMEKETETKVKVEKEMEKKMEKELASSSKRNSTRIKVLVTSLYLSLHDVVAKMYREGAAEGGESVAVVQVTHEDSQGSGVDVEREAFAEILLLSLSDDLVLAPVSTFGGSAQTYGGLTPWFVEYRKEEELPACERGRSVEVCNQYTSKIFDCKYDYKLGNKLFSNVVPFIEDCPQIEFPFLSESEQGVHLKTTFVS